MPAKALPAWRVGIGTALIGTFQITVDELSIGAAGVIVPVTIPIVIEDTAAKGRIVGREIRRIVGGVPDRRIVVIGIPLLRDGVAANTILQGHILGSIDAIARTRSRSWCVDPIPVGETATKG